MIEGWAFEELKASWWFSVVAMGIALNLLSAALWWLFGKTIRAQLSRRSERAARAKKLREERLERLVRSPHLRILEVSAASSQIAFAGMLATLSLFGFAGWSLGRAVWSDGIVPSLFATAAYWGTLFGMFIAIRMCFRAAARFRDVSEAVERVDRDPELRKQLYEGSPPDAYARQART